MQVSLLWHHDDAQPKCRPPGRAPAGWGDVVLFFSVWVKRAEQGVSSPGMARGGGPLIPLTYGHNALCPAALDLLVFLTSFPGTGGWGGRGFAPKLGRAFDR